MAAAETLGFHAHPAVTILAAVFLEVDLPVVVLAKARHGGELLLHDFKKVQERFPAVRKVHLRTQPHVDVEVLAEAAKRSGHKDSPTKPRLIAARILHAKTMNEIDPTDLLSAVCPDPSQPISLKRDD